MVQNFATARVRCLVPKKQLKTVHFREHGAATGRQALVVRQKSFITSLNTQYLHDKALEVKSSAATVGNGGQ